MYYNKNAVMCTNLVIKVTKDQISDGKKLFMVGRNYVQIFMLSAKVHNLVIFAGYVVLLIINMQL